MKHLLVILFISNIIFITSKTKEEWKSRAIYQILTDRFARTDDFDTSNCDLGNYCGGNIVD